MFKIQLIKTIIFFSLPISLQDGFAPPDEVQPEDEEY